MVQRSRAKEVVLALLPPGHCAGPTRRVRDLRLPVAGARSSAVGAAAGYHAGGVGAPPAALAHGGPWGERCRRRVSSCGVPWGAGGSGQGRGSVRPRALPVGDGSWLLHRPQASPRYMTLVELEQRRLAAFGRRVGGGGGLRAPPGLQGGHGSSLHRAGVPPAHATLPGAAWTAGRTMGRGRAPLLWQAPGDGHPPAVGVSGMADGPWTAAAVSAPLYVSCAEGGLKDGMPQASAHRGPWLRRVKPGFCSLRGQSQWLKGSGAQPCCPTPSSEKDGTGFMVQRREVRACRVGSRETKYSTACDMKSRPRAQAPPPLTDGQRADACCYRTGKCCTFGRRQELRLARLMAGSLHGQPMGKAARMTLSLWNEQNWNQFLHPFFSAAPATVTGKGASNKQASPR